MSPPFPSIKDVAEKAGTSISTVSNVLNNRRAVGDEIRGKVLSAVQELGYEANHIARSLKNKKSNTIGVIVSDINCIFFAPLLKGIQKVISEAGYSMTIYDSGYSLKREVQYIRSLRNSWADGVIIAGTAVQTHDDEFAHLIDTPRARPMPLVSLEHNMNRFGIDSIFIDNAQSALTATNHLIELGCTRIVHVTGPDVGHSFQRLEGYREALAKAGLRYEETLVAHGDFSPISGYKKIHALLQSGISFDGVFAANDQMAVGALRALDIAGINVPEQVKVVGFDNTFIASIVNPSLTTISVPNYDMGVHAAKLLLDRIHHPEKKAAAITLDYELIIRRSTMTSARTNWDMSYW